MASGGVCDLSVHSVLPLLGKYYSRQRNVKRLAHKLSRNYPQSRSRLTRGSRTRIRNPSLSFCARPSFFSLQMNVKINRPREHRNIFKSSRVFQVSSIGVPIMRDYPRLLRFVFSSLFMQANYFFPLFFYTRIELAIKAMARILFLLDALSNNLSIS